MDLNFQKSWAHSCVNCNKDLEYSSTSNKINNIIVNLRLPVNSDSFVEEISVYEALSCLFHLHLIEKNFEKSNESTKKNIWVCFSCSLTLKDLYRRYREFSLLRNSSSYLAYKIEQLEKDILAGSSSSMNTVPSYAMASPLVLQELVLPQSGTVQQDQLNTNHHVLGTSKVGLTTQSQVSGNQQQQQQQQLQQQQLQQHQQQVQDIIFDASLQQGLVEIVFNDSTAENAILSSNTTINDFADLVTLPGYMVELAGGTGSPNFQKEIALVSQPMNFMMNNPPDVLCNPNPMGTSDRKPEVVAQKSKAKPKNTNNRKKNPVNPPGSATQQGSTAAATTSKKRPPPNPNNQAKSTTTTSSTTKSKKNVKRKENSTSVETLNSTFPESKKSKTKKTTPSTQQQSQQQQEGVPKPAFPTVEVQRTTPEPIENFRVASSEPPYSCPKCRKELKDKCAYAKHVYNHSQQNKYPCPKCRLKYSKYSSLRHHCEYHHFLTPIEPPAVRELKPKEIVHVVFENFQ